jgi:hypothetical protein
LWAALNTAAHGSLDRVTDLAATPGPLVLADGDVTSAAILVAREVLRATRNDPQLFGLAQMTVLAPLEAELLRPGNPVTCGAIQLVAAVRTGLAALTW